MTGIDLKRFEAIFGIAHKKLQANEKDIGWPDMTPMPADPDALPLRSSARDYMEILVKRAKNRGKSPK